MKSKIILASFALLLLLPLGINLFHPAIAKADNTPGLTSSDVKGGSLRWVNRATIQAAFAGNTFIFTDSNIGDTTFEYKIESDYGCAGSGGGKSGTITLPTIENKNNGVRTPD